jgi:hypothetical protein
MTDAQIVLPAPGAALIRKCRSERSTTSQASAFLIASACHGLKLICVILTALPLIAFCTQGLPVLQNGFAAVRERSFVVGVKGPANDLATFLTLTARNEAQDLPLATRE